MKEMDSVFFVIRFVFSTAGVNCSLGLFVIILIGVLTKRIPSFVLIILSVLLVMLIIIQLSVFIWLLIDWGQPYIRWKHPVYKIKVNRGLF